MNHLALVDSLKYLRRFELVASLSNYTNSELIRAQYTDKKIWKLMIGQEHNILQVIQEVINEERYKIFLIFTTIYYAYVSMKVTRIFY